MSDDIIAQAIAAARHAESIMRRTAAGENIALTPDEPHGDWRPKYKNDGRPTIQKWHPPYGETHVKYHVYALGGGKNPIIWGSNHHGTYQGMQTVDAPLGKYESITHPYYEHSDDPEHLGRFKTYDQAKAAAEEHYRQNYGTPPKHDYDIDKIMGEPGTNSHPKRGLGDDEDYSRIFDAVRRALKKAGLALREAAVYNWKPYIPSLVQQMQEAGLWDDKWGGEPAEMETRSDAGDHYYVRPAGSLFNQLPKDHPHKRTGDPDHWEVDHLPPEYGHDPEGYMGDIYGPTALNKFAEPVEGVGPQGFSSMQEAMDWVHSRHPEEKFNPDEKQDPFDPRLIGASRRYAAGANEPDYGEFQDISWPGDLSPHLSEPTGYSAGYAARNHPSFIEDDEYPMWPEPHESYKAAGGTGPDFEAGYDDASNDLPHKLDDPQGYADHFARERAITKRNRDSVDQQKQDKHNRLRDKGDHYFDEHDPGFQVRYTPWKSERHPEGSWEGCPTCSDNGYGPNPVSYSDPDDNPDPFDPRLLGAGLHARLAAQAAAVDQGVMGRIAAELSPPCPDCGQVAGFDDHMVSPSVKVCRNCDYPMLDYGVQNLLDRTLSGHDKAIAELPETDHPTLGKHGARPRKPKNPFGSDPAHSYATTCSECLTPIYGHPDDIATKNPKASWVDAQNNDGAEDETHGHHYHWPEELAAW